MGIFGKLADLERTGAEAALATVVRARGAVPRHAGSKMIVYPDGRIEGTIGGGEMESRVVQQALEVLALGETRLLHYTFNDPDKGDPGVCGGEMEVFVEPLRSRSTVVVVGGGHVGKAVVHLAKWLGFRVVVSDDRTEFATTEAVPEADETIVCPLRDLTARTKIDGQTYVVLTTRGVEIDAAGLPALLDSTAAYIGVIGSRRRWEICARELRALGVAEDKIARVTSPIGLELNAETPEEIAVSVLAQIIMLRRGGSGEPMAHAPAGQRAGKGA